MSGFSCLWSAGFMHSDAVSRSPHAEKGSGADIGVMGPGASQEYLSLFLGFPEGITPLDAS